MAGDDPTAFVTSGKAPLEFVPVKTAEDSYPIPEQYRSRLLVNVIHDGTMIPAELLLDEEGRQVPAEAFQWAYELERDWGASAVAREVASYLGLGGFLKVNIARVLMDFGRFPGMSRQQPDHLQRFAINYPFSELLSYDQKRRVLEHYYDKISEEMDRILHAKLINLAIHTYDRLNRSGTERPQISLVTRAVGYQLDSRMPFGVFDCLYPDILGEFTCNRVLRDRISLTMEKAGLPVAHNYPYLLPEGSLEVRAQVWFFFSFLRERFEKEYPDTSSDTSFQRVWNLLMDTNLRSSDSEILRSYLHMFRRAPKGREEELRRAQRAYERVSIFLHAEGSAIVDQYRHSPDRTSSLGLEVRKDLVWKFDEKQRPIHPRLDNARRIGRVIARAVSVYLCKDRADEVPPGEGFARRNPWYHHQVPPAEIGIRESARWPRVL